MLKDYILPGLFIFAIFYAVGAFIVPVAIDKEMDRKRAVQHSLYERGYIK